MPRAGKNNLKKITSHAHPPGVHGNLKNKVIRQLQFGTIETKREPMF